jgi:hypothetical protein
VTLFVSYARANNLLAVKFLDRLRQQLEASKKYRYNFWRDSEILVGEPWHDEIQKAIEESELGVLLISPAFLGSQYIGRHELPRFVGKRRKGQKAKPVIPVMLQPVDLDHQDLKGLREAQIFRLENPRTGQHKAYGECGGANRDRFAQLLFKQIEKRLDLLLA